MSHTMNITLEMKDHDALVSACSRIGAETLGYGNHRLYSTSENGFGIKLAGWNYPVVVKDDGKVAFDNYNGHWGDIKDFNGLKAYYGIEKAKIEARRSGHEFYETYDEQKQELQLRISV